MRHKRSIPNRGFRVADQIQRDVAELIRDLNREPTTCGLPVVVLTTRAGAKHVSFARELGVEHYVAKPVDEASFVQLIESLAVAAPARAGA